MVMFRRILKWVLWITGIFLAMLVLVVASVVLRVLRFKKEEYISFENPDGEVIIAIRAIEDFLKRLARSFGEVKEITPTIIPLNEGVDYPPTIINRYGMIVGGSCPLKISNCLGPISVHIVFNNPNR